VSDEGVRKAMRRSDVSRRLAAAVACCILALTACNSNPEPTVESPPPKPKKTTPSASPTPTPPSPSVSPGEAPERTFVRHYIDLLNYAESTGDVAPMLEVSAPGCKSCKGAADVIKKVYEAGGHYEGDHVQKIEWIEAGGKSALVGTKFGDYRVVPSPGAEPKAYKADKSVYDFRLQKKGDEWLVAEIMVSQD
jgi:hypothetical protein